MVVWHQVEACAFVRAGPSSSRWSVTYLPMMLPLLGPRERHVSYGRGFPIFV